MRAASEVATVAAAEAAPPTVDVAAAEAHVQGVVMRSGTSFYWGMRLLPAAKRKAMFAIYAFCREVDDIADGDDSPDVKRGALGRWRQEIDALFAGRPTRATTIALQVPIRRFDLPRGEFHAMIDGMEMDAGEGMRAPPMDQLSRYCRCVAGAVGLLSIRVFGAHDPQVERGAVALGEALQLTNILRDVIEDAACGRLYLPHELLDRHGVPVPGPDDDLTAVLDHPGLPEVCAALADGAEALFAEADRRFAHADRRQLRPALIMMHVYRRTLDRLMARGWHRLQESVRLSKTERLWLALRHGVL